VGPAVLEDAPPIVRRSLLRWWRRLKREPGGMLFATFIQQRNVVARTVWARIATGHQRVVGSLLAQAVRRAQ